MAYNAAAVQLLRSSLEMSKIEIAQRLLASESKVDLQIHPFSLTSNSSDHPFLESAKVFRLKTSLMIPA